MAWPLALRVSVRMIYAGQYRLARAPVAIPPTTPVTAVLLLCCGASRFAGGAAGADADDPHRREARAAGDRVAGQHHHPIPFAHRTCLASTFYRRSHPVGA